MSGFFFVQNERTRKCFTEIETKIEDTKKRAKFVELAKKNELTIEDLNEIEEITPKDLPALFVLLCEFRRVREPDYKASPEFREKTNRLQKHFEDRQYKKLVESVDPAQSYGATPLMADFGTDLRAVNRQLGTILNFVITVGGGFFFGFTGITYAYPSRNFELAERFILGLIPATLIFFADLYFLIKNMDEELAPRTIDTVGRPVPLDLRKFNTGEASTSKEEPIKEAPLKSKKDKKND